MFNDAYYLEEVRPVLRVLSPENFTEKELEFYMKVFPYLNEHLKQDWYIKHFFDYRGLLNLRLAVPASDGEYADWITDDSEFNKNLS